MDDLTQKIRDRAYEIWLEAGQPEGMEQQHWAQAERELGVAGSDDATGEREDRLDDSLEETFPSSDPVSEAQPGGGITGPGDDR